MGEPYAVLNLPGIKDWAPRRRTIGFSIHHTVTRPPADDPDAEIASILAVHNYHAGLGWGGHGYHAAGFESGRWYLINANMNLPRAGVANRNHELYHIVAYGIYTYSVPPGGMLHAISSALNHAKGVYGDLPHAGHREWAVAGYETGCPGEKFEQWVPYLGDEGGDEDMPDPRLSDSDIEDLKYLMRRNSRDGTWYPDWEDLRQLAHDTAAVRDSHSKAIAELGVMVNDLKNQDMTPDEIEARILEIEETLKRSGELYANLGGR